MHHPDICNIMLIIEDYFMLVDDKDSRCQIKSIVDQIDEDNCLLGIQITRKLLNGYMCIDIIGEGRDDDTVTFNYLKDFNSSNYIESIEIECSDYSSEAVRTSVRNILKLDKALIKPKSIPIPA
jgi:hypothetical protein